MKHDHHLTFHWGLRIGEIVGEHFEDEGVPAYLPTSTGGLIVTAEGDDARVVSAIHALIESVVLHQKLTVAEELLDVHVFDFDVRKRFTHLARLSAVGRYVIYHHDEVAQKALNRFEQLITERHHELLDEVHTTVFAFNQDCGTHERYSMVIVNLQDFPKQSRQYEQFLKWLPAAYEAGIFVIFIQPHAWTVGKSDDPLVTDHIQKMKLNFEAWIRNHFAEVLIRMRGDAPELILSDHEMTADLNQVLRDMGAQIVPENGDLSLMVNQCIDLAQKSDSRKDFLNVEMGNTQDGRNKVFFRLGERVGNYHSLILGATGTGKTTFLNNLILQIAENYTSEEIRLYLMDYKDGVEFQVFEKHPNCEKIFLDNQDVLAATRMLSDFESEMARRNSIFKQHGVSNLNAYNALEGVERIPRLILIIDEVQALFENQKVANTFHAQLVKVTKQGRGPGVHIILSTQSLLGASLSKELLSQMSSRVAFRLDDQYDCEKVLSFGNLAPYHLNAFEAIYNVEAGRPRGNLFCRTLPRPEIEERLNTVIAKLPKHLILTPDLVQSDEVDNPTNTSEEKTLTLNDLNAPSHGSHAPLETTQSKLSALKTETEDLWSSMNTE